MEKRLQAFVRMAHTIIVFPGGGDGGRRFSICSVSCSARRIPRKRCRSFSRARRRAEVLRAMLAFSARRSGPLHNSATRWFSAIRPPSPRKWHGPETRARARAADDNAYFFNWGLDIGLEFQKPFEATHESMRALELKRDQPAHSLAFNFAAPSRASSRATCVRPVSLASRTRPFELRGDPKIIAALGNLLQDFVTEPRMRCRIRARTYPVIECRLTRPRARHYRQTRLPQGRVVNWFLGSRRSTQYSSRIWGQGLSADYERPKTTSVPTGLVRAKSVPLPKSSAPTASNTAGTRTVSGYRGSARNRRASNSARPLDLQLARLSQWADKVRQSWKDG